MSEQLLNNVLCVEIYVTFGGKNPRKTRRLTGVYTTKPRVQNARESSSLATAYRVKRHTCNSVLLDAIRCLETHKNAPAKIISHRRSPHLSAPLDPTSTSQKNLISTWCTLQHLNS